MAPVDAEVDCRLEAAEITRRIAREGGPALLFRRVKGHDIPLLTNLLGSESRVCRALGVDTLEEAAGRVQQALKPSGDGWLERLGLGAHGGSVASLAANRVKSGACQQVLRLGSDVQLEELPCTQGSKEAPLPAIASATMLSAEPDSHAQVFLRGDVQISGRDRLTAAWSDMAGAAALLGEYAARQARMPVAVVVGGDPAVHLGAAAPVPSTVDPLGLAGWLREKPLDAVACRTIDLLAPAESDIVIEGFIDAAEGQAETGPRSSPTGRLIGKQPGYTVHVTAITHRANRIFSAAIPQRESSEVCLRDRVMARVFLPLLKMRIPDLVDFDLPMSGGARRLAVVAIRKTHAGQAHQAATSAWAVRPFHFAKLLVVVDADVDVRDAEQVWAAIAHETHPVRDISTHPAPPDPLDPALRPANLGGGWRSTPRGSLPLKAMRRAPHRPLGSRRGKAGRRPLVRVRPGTGARGPWKSINLPPACGKCSARLPGGTIC